MTIQITTEQLFETYKPIKNPVDNTPSWDGCMFETFGVEHEFVMAQDPNHIWSIVESDGNIEVTNGYHYVNAIGYLISEVASPDDFVVVSDEDDLPNLETMRVAIIEDAYDSCMNDSGYLRSILTDYFSDMSEEMIRKNYIDMQ